MAILATMTAFWMALFGTSLMFYVATAADPSNLQDFCVGVDDFKSSVFVNGRFCKNPKEVTINDFIYKGFNDPKNTSNTANANNTLGTSVVLLDVDLFPALNTLGLAIGRIEFGPFGINPPHVHPRASEIFMVLEGTLYVGFVTTDNKLYDTVISKGDIVVFPQGLIHFQLNMGKTDALGIASFGGQNPGRFNIADAMFGTTPPMHSDLLIKSFQVGDRVIQKLESQFRDEDAILENGRSFLKLLSEAV